MNFFINLFPLSLLQIIDGSKKANGSLLTIFAQFRLNKMEAKEKDSYVVINCLFFSSNC